MAHYLTTSGAGIWDSVDNASSAYEAVENFLMTTASEFSRRDRPSGCMVVLSGLHANDATAALREELVAGREQNTDGLARRLTTGVDNGEVPATADIATIARFYVTVQEGMSIQARDGADYPTLAAIARSALAAWQPLIATGA